MTASVLKIFRRDRRSMPAEVGVALGRTLKTSASHFSLSSSSISRLRHAHILARHFDFRRDDDDADRAVEADAPSVKRHLGRKSVGEYLKDFDTFGTWDNRIDRLPILMEESIKKGKPIPAIGLDLVGSASLQGRKQEQEDRIQVMELEKGILYFGVFDGHRGSLAADFMKSRLHHHVRFQLNRGEKDLEKVLRNAFISANNAFARHIIDVSCPTDRESGTTATVSLLRNSVHLVTAHVGDSRALLFRNGETNVLTRDHEPEDRDEKARVLKDRGAIVWTSLGRPLVGGRLAMTRSLGDMDLKGYGVAATPETSSLAIKHGADAFLALVSDGVSFVMSNSEMGNCVAACDNAAEAARTLCDQALQFGSEDDVSAIVVPFGSWGKFTRQSLVYSFGRNLQGRRN